MRHGRYAFALLAALVAASAGCSQETVAARRIVMRTGPEPLNVSRIHVLQEGWSYPGIFFRRSPDYATAAVALECEDGRVLVIWRSSSPLHEAAGEKPIPDRMNDMRLEWIAPGGSTVARENRIGPAEHHVTLWPSADGGFRSSEPGFEGHLVPRPPQPPGVPYP